MKLPSTLAVASEPSRFTLLESWDLESGGFRPLAPGLWVLRGERSHLPEGACRLLRPVARAASLERLLRSAASSSQQIPARWRLSRDFEGAIGKRIFTFLPVGAFLGLFQPINRQPSGDTRLLAFFFPAARPSKLEAYPEFSPAPAPGPLRGNTRF